MYNSIKLTLFLILITQLALAQPAYLPMNYELHSIFENTYYQQENNHPAIRPFLISNIEKYEEITKKLRYPALQKWDNRLLNKNLFEIIKKNFTINVNPQFSYFRKIDPVAKSDAYFEMGFNINGNIKKKLAFAANWFYIDEVIDQRYLNNINFSGIIPHFNKYENRYINQFTLTGFTGYLSYSPNKTFNFQLGKGKNFLGDGYRTLFLSDNADSYPYLKLSVDVWKFKYVNIIARLKDIEITSLTTNANFSNELQGKYAAIHFLSWNLTKRLNFHIFEAIIWNERDSVGFRGLDINYLNPVIFYRPVEFSMGSPDNEILGIGGRLRIFKATHFYGQFLLDEFILKHIKARDKWWGNKFGVQVGVKIFDPFKFKGLMLQAEYNYVRPYTYSHENSLQNYGNVYQPMAHPLGANFDEYIGIVRYNVNRMVFTFKVNYSEKGMDKYFDPFIYGGDIYKPYTSLRLLDATGMLMKQGALSKFFQSEIKGSVLINQKANLSFDVTLVYQSSHYEQSKPVSKFILVGLKTNLFNNYFDF